MERNLASFDSAYDKILALTADFEANIAYFNSAEFQESNVRLQYIDKFLTALGWDVSSDYSKNPMKREVIVEKPQRQQDSKNQKRADYAFFIPPDFKYPKFFLEAKKPSRNLKTQDNYFQTARYGWNAGLGMSVLSDFEELHVIDCRFKPDINSVFNADNRSFHFTEYRNKETFQSIYWLISKEAVLAGNIDAYVESLQKPQRGAYQAKLFSGKYQSIDESFLEELDGIRLALAKAFKKNNIELDSEQLTEDVQRTIDRLVFIRFLEDKLIEPDNYVSEFGNKNTVWIDFINTCASLNAKYNGIVFRKHEIDKKDFLGADDFQFKNICNELSHLNTPYDFNVIPIHILGSIYERFLGKVVIATGSRAHVEEKHLVRKSKGVYYTPQYIVDYIIRNTIGKLINGKSPKDIAKMRFADISCGSGSFLIGVLDCLLDYHTYYYNEKKEDAKKDKCIFQNGRYVLSLKQKQQILLNNIYGVDIDRQATEVTQLSLYLKMLEDETTATANEMQVLFHEKILPDLKNNIKCGNSLIYKNGFNLFEELTEEEENIMKPFDYKSNFEEVFKAGGFDAIIGNPPYINVKLQDQFIKSFIKSKYKYSKGADLYIAFFERGLGLLKNKGKLGFIVPNKFFGAEYGKRFRDELKNNFVIDHILDEKDRKVFKDALISCVALTISKDKKGKMCSITQNDKLFEVPYTDLFDSSNKIQIESNSEEKKLLSKLDKMNKLVTQAQVRTGIMGFEYWRMKDIINSNGKRNSNSIKLYVNGNFNRYSDNWSNQDIKLYKGIYIRPTINLNPEFLNENTIELFQIKGKILVRGVARQVSAIVDEHGSGLLVAVHSIIGNNWNSYFLLSIINSNLINWLHLKTIYSIRIPQGSLKYPVSFFENIPIPKINMSNGEDRKKYDRLTKLSESIMSSKESMLLAKTDGDREYLEGKIKSLDNQIDSIVYQLYGLSVDEIYLIESRHSGQSSI